MIWRTVKMKNKFYAYLLAVVAAAYVIINILVFTLVPFGRLNVPQFWISYGFMFGVNIVATAVIGLALKKTEKNDIRFYPISLIGGGNIVYLGLGVLFTLFADKIAVRYVVMADLVVAIIYALLALRLVISITYIRGNDSHKRKKVAYIRGLTDMVEGYSSLAADADTSELIEKLASDFRYSDPMSDETLAEAEKKLTELVIGLEDIVREGDGGKVRAAVDEIKRELKLRNAMCANLK